MSDADGTTTLDFSRFRARRVREQLLGLLDQLFVAIERRDLVAAWRVLDEAEVCRCIPPALREEALLIARMPAASFRAPIRLYRFYHRIAQLGDEPIEATQDAAQLTMDLAPSPAGPPVRELHFPERPAPGRRALP